MDGACRREGAPGRYTPRRPRRPSIGERHEDDLVREVVLLLYVLLRMASTQPIGALKRFLAA